MTRPRELIPFEDALQGRVDAVTLAGALRDVLPVLEAELDDALQLLAQAQAELTRARGAGMHEDVAERTARLARTAVDIAARQVALRRATLETLERDAAEPESE